MEKEPKIEKIEKEWEPGELDDVLEGIIEKNKEIVYHYTSRYKADFDSIFKHGLVSQRYARKKGIEIKPEYPGFQHTGYINVFYYPEISKKETPIEKKKLSATAMSSKWGNVKIICGVDKSKLISASKYRAASDIDYLVEDNIPPEEINAIAMDEGPDEFKEEPEEYKQHEDIHKILVLASENKIPVYGWKGSKLNSKEILDILENSKRIFKTEK